MLAFFLKPFLIAFTVSTVLLLVFLSATQLIPWLKYRREQWFRFGGIAIMLGFLAAFFLDGRVVLTLPLIGLLLGILVITGFGIWDDIFNLSWKAQVFFQSMLGTLLFLFGVRITFLTNPFGGVFSFSPDTTVMLGFVIGLVWLFLLMNALNWLDGSDGLCGGVSIIAILTIFFLALKPEVNQPAFAIIAASGAGAVGGFLLFNLPPARIFAGTTGSMFLGFLLAFLATAAGTKIATALLVLALPIADAMYVIMERLLSGKSVFEGDKRHLHHKLQRLGWSQKRITFVLLFFTGVVAIVALQTRAESKLIALAIVFFSAFFSSFLVAKRVEHTTTIQDAAGSL
jgi:UDP-GlcNAc:undecaprenyl-phosphate GlcNAc-1-phosphate transferase